jgi:RNA polymerase sigma-70 factor (ECF subfamily)
LGFRAALAALTTFESSWDGAPAMGAGSAMAEAVRAHEGLLLATARRLCGNAADADDLVHDTYERALRAWDQYAERGNLKAWLMSIMHNRFIDRCRKGRRDPKTEDITERDFAAPEPSPPPAWAEVSADQISRAVDRIGAEFRAVYELHTAGRSYDEIARELGIAKNTVGTRLLRARKKLKETLLEEIGRGGAGP